jgi:hypothetical protein
MEPIRTTKTARLRYLELYREDLDELIALFKSCCATVAISDSKFRYDSLDEMMSSNGPVVRDLDIRSDSPALHFLLNRKEVIAGSTAPAIFNELRTEELTDAADVLFLKVREFLLSHQKPIARWPFALIAGFALVAAIVLTVRDPRPQVVPWSALLCAFVMLASGVGALKFNNQIVLMKRSESKSFWARNKEQFATHTITAAIGAILGAVVGWLVGHFSILH